MAKIILGVGVGCTVDTADFGELGAIIGLLVELAIFFSFGMFSLGRIGLVTITFALIGALTMLMKKDCVVDITEEE